MKVNRNGGASLADKLILTSGTLTYGGTLVVSNAGAALTGGERFTNFAAQSFGGAFADAKLPGLNPGLNWYLGDLLVNGSIKVNRSPVAGTLNVTNTATASLQIPIASLIANSTDADGDPIALTGIDMTTTNGITLLTNETHIVYANNMNVADRFNYTIGDGHGGIASGVVTIAPGTIAQFIGPPTVGSNSVTIHFSGGPDSTYFLERSTNLADWFTISTNVIPPSGLADFTDHFLDLNEPPALAFYRLRWSP
jgi:hypothetical protein